MYLGGWGGAQSSKLNLVPCTQILGPFGPPQKFDLILTTVGGVHRFRKFSKILSIFWRLPSWALQFGHFCHYNWRHGCEVENITLNKNIAETPLLNIMGYLDGLGLHKRPSLYFDRRSVNSSCICYRNCIDLTLILLFLGWHLAFSFSLVIVWPD